MDLDSRIDKSLPHFLRIYLNPLQHKDKTSVESHLFFLIRSQPSSKSKNLSTKEQRPLFSLKWLSIHSKKKEKQTQDTYRHAFSLESHFSVSAEADKNTAKTNRERDIIED